MQENYPELFLDNQICFPLYALSRLITQRYTPLLKKLDLTYPQYLVLLVLWEQDKQSVGAISAKLLLESNTLTPLLKRMEEKGLLQRQRDTEDERVVLISLEEKGKALQKEAVCVPTQILASFGEDEGNPESLSSLRSTLQHLLKSLDAKASED